MVVDLLNLVDEGRDVDAGYFGCVGELPDALAAEQANIGQCSLGDAIGGRNGERLGLQSGHMFEQMLRVLTRAGDDQTSSTAVPSAGGVVDAGCGRACKPQSIPLSR